MTKLFGILLLIAAHAAVAGDRPDFSGSWKMDPDQSNFGALPPTTSMTRTIDHQDPRISVNDFSVSPAGDLKIQLKYSTDGKETLNQFMGNELKSTVNWSGNTLVIHSALDAGGEHIKSTDVWTLSSDGKTLTDVLSVSTAQGDFEITYVLLKQ